MILFFCIHLGLVLGVIKFLAFVEGEISFFAFLDEDENGDVGFPGYYLLIRRN